MQNRTSLVIVALLAGAVSLSSMSSAFAHERGGERGRDGGQRGDRQERMAERQGPGGFMHFVCNTDGAERLEAALGKASETLKLTDEQTALFDAFKAAALTAQTSFADACTTPTRGEGDMIDNLTARQANMQAMVTAMDEVLPSLEAFHDSLTDAQKADLRPDHRGGQRPKR